MSGKDFKQWMEEKGLSVVDVSFFTRLSANTIYTFMREESVNDSTLQSLQVFVTAFNRGEYPLRRRGKVPVPV